MAISVEIRPYDKFDLKRIQAAVIEIVDLPTNREVADELKIEIESDSHINHSFHYQSCSRTQAIVGGNSVESILQALERIKAGRDSLRRLLNSEGAVLVAGGGLFSLKGRPIFDTVTGEILRSAGSQYQAIIAKAMVTSADIIHEAEARVKESSTRLCLPILSPEDIAAGWQVSASRDGIYIEAYLPFEYHPFLRDGLKLSKRLANRFRNKSVLIRWDLRQPEPGKFELFVPPKLTEKDTGEKFQHYHATPHTDCWGSTMGDRLLDMVGGEVTLAQLKSVTLELEILLQEINTFDIANRHPKGFPYLRTPRGIRRRRWERTPEVTEWTT